MCVIYFDDPIVQHATRTPMRQCSRLVPGRQLENYSYQLTPIHSAVLTVPVDEGEQKILEVLSTEGVNIDINTRAGLDALTPLATAAEGGADIRYEKDAASVFPVREKEKKTRNIV